MRQEKMGETLRKTYPDSVSSTMKPHGVTEMHSLRTSVVRGKWLTACAMVQRTIKVSIHWSAMHTPQELQYFRGVRSLTSITSAA